jgi:glycosyltransferase involved in cell wall biosynthesis
MKVLHVNFSDTSGGSAIALRRLHSALRNAGVDSWVLVNDKKGSDEFYISPKNLFQTVLSFVLPRISVLITRTFIRNSHSVNSLNYFSTRWVDFINKSDFDIVHLHWLSGEMLSISDIKKIKKPLAWTFHDMWAFCGTEHVTYSTDFKSGYKTLTFFKIFPKFNLKGLIWNYKKKSWKNKFTVICPSSWMARCVRESVIFCGWNPLVIPNLIDTSFWSPQSTLNSRIKLGLTPESPVILFGAFGGIGAFHKGFDLLLQSLRLISDELSSSSSQILVLGTSSDTSLSSLGLPITFLGHVNDEADLVKVYSSASILLLPSRVDNFPNTALESLACGTPVIAFDCCGLPDIITHKQNGYLASAFDVDDFAQGILWGLSSRDETRRCARNSVLERFSHNARINSFLDLYNVVKSEFK